MRILILGRDGQLGRELSRLAPALGEVVALDVEDVDLCNPDAIREEIKAVQPGIILNAAAYTAVDQAEQEPDQAMRVNTEAPGVLAETARQLRAVLVHFSTDFVFDGEKSTPYTEQDVPNPINAYGRSKLAGEKAVMAGSGTVFILRTSWLYSLQGDNFVIRVLRWSRQQETLNIVEDQVGSPTWAVHLAQATLAIFQNMGTDPYYELGEKCGLYHLAGKGFASRYEWALAILAADPHREEQICRHVEPAASIDFPTPARRPKFSALDSTLFEHTFACTLPSWQESLKAMFH